MIRLITIVLASIVFCYCASQRNAKVYAYRQAVFGGARPNTVVDEKGNAKPTPAKESANFFIYLESPVTDVQVKEIWIKQKAYDLKEVIVVAAPVVLKPELKINAPDTLVKATNNKVLQLVVGAQTQATSASAVVLKNEVAVRCVVSGRERYFTAGSIKNLPPVALQ